MSLQCIASVSVLSLTFALCAPAQQLHNITNSSDITSSSRDLFGETLEDSNPDRPHTAFERLNQRLADSVHAFPSTTEPTGAGTVSVAELRHGGPKMELGLIQQAQRLSNAGDHNKAIQILERGIQESPWMSHARGMLGTEYLRIGQTRAAITQLKQAVTLLPLVAANHSNLGYALCRIGERQAGEQEIREAIRLDPSLSKAHFVLGVILLDRDTPEARDQLLLAHDVSNAHLGLAVYHSRHGEGDEVQQELRAFLHANPKIDPRGLALWVAAAAPLQAPSSAFGFPAAAQRTLRSGLDSDVNADGR
jgi:tetratricopeptide (TPR) repeat protein